MTNKEYYFGNNVGSKVAELIAIAFAKWIRNNYVTHYPMNNKEWWPHKDQDCIAYDTTELFEQWLNSEYEN